MLDFREGLHKYSRPGFNQLERDFYAEEVIGNEAMLVRYQELAEKVAASKGIDIEKVYDIFLKASQDAKSALEQLGGFMIELQEIMAEQNRQQRHQKIRLVEMLLRSRLRPDFLLGNTEELDQEFGVQIPEKERDYLLKLPRNRWLKDAIREDVIKQICWLLPSSIVNELYEAAQFEMFEGNVPEATDSESIDETLGKQGGGSGRLNGQSSRKKKKGSKLISGLPSTA